VVIDIGDQEVVAIVGEKSTGRSIDGGGIE
jgi:ABC-type dipeptide/oligopeptide/nickel transport system ATPase component